MALDLSKIVTVDFPVDQYVAVNIKKKQIVLHHTVSGSGVDGDINHWKSSKARVATSVIIDREGVIHQCFSTKYWAHHLGIKTGVIKEAGTSVSNLALNQHSIGIELDSYGGLVKKEGKYYTVYGNEISEDRVVSYKEEFRGYKYYENYTNEQLATLKDLLDFLCDKYSIPSDFKLESFEVSKDALNGVPGIYSHTSYRKDKSDVHPQTELVAMLMGKEVKPAAKKPAAKKPAAKKKAAPKKKPSAKTKGVK
jgi:hypothetical protein